MRVVVVGASGNVGTAVLRALARTPEVSSVVGVSRRVPDLTTEPYSQAEWQPVDIGAGALPSNGHTSETTGGADRATDRLTEVFAGADAVIHLAWLIQPNHRREVMRWTNVDGTRRVARACVRAGVPHLVSASSWAAYSPVDDDVPRDEGWRTGGIRSSHYSVDKAAQERVLDHADRDNPDLTVSRLRTALIFQRDAGAEIARYFIGPYVPVALLRPGSLPVLPLPSGLRLHVVHADDAADAYVRTVVRRAPGAFNVAASDLLWPKDLAAILDHGRFVTLPPGLLRPPMEVAWRLRLIAADAGWLDMGMGVPVMDTSRVRDVLGWSERHSAAEAVTEMVEGIAERRGVAGGGPLRPTDRRLRGPRT